MLSFPHTVTLSFPHTSRQELHDEVEGDRVLEGIVHLDHPGIVCLHQNVPLCPGMGDLWGGEGREGGGVRGEGGGGEEVPSGPWPYACPHTSVL